MFVTLTRKSVTILWFCTNQKWPQYHNFSKNLDTLTEKSIQIFIMFVYSMQPLTNLFFTIVQLLKMSSFKCEFTPKMCSHSFSVRLFVNSLVHIKSKQCFSNQMKTEALNRLKKSMEKKERLLTNDKRTKWHKKTVYKMSTFNSAAIHLSTKNKCDALLDYKENSQ